MRKIAIFIAAAFVLSAIPSGLKAETTPASTGTPDLVVTADKLSINKTSVKDGDKITLKAIVRNTGTAAARNVKVRLYWDGAKVFEKTVPLIYKTIGSVAVTYVMELPSNVYGQKQYKAIVDPDGAIAELNEANNEATKTIDVQRANRDFSIVSIKAGPSNPKAGQLVTWTVKVKSAGNAKATNVKVRFFADNTSSEPSGTVTIPAMGMNSTVSKTFKWTVPAGAAPAVGYSVRADVDADNRYAETNEANNVKMLSINLKAPNLKIVPGDNTYTKGPLYKGVRLAQWAKVVNDNVLPASNVKVALYYHLGSDATTAIKIAEQELGTLSKKESRDIYIQGTLPDTLPLGTLIHVVLKIDPTDIVVESNEVDNELLATRTLIEKPRTVIYPYLRVNVIGEDGNPLNGATVKVTNMVTGAFETKVTGSETYYYSQGNVIFESRPATANYRIEVTEPGYRPYSETLAFDQYSDSATDRQVYLDKNALVTGRVTDQAGAPLADVKVRIEGTGLEAMTDRQGKYGFLLNGGTYDFRFIKSGYARLMDSGKVIAPISTLTLDKVMATAAVGYMSGTVTDDGGEPLQNADIWVNGNLIRVTGAAGTFDFQSSPGTKTFKIKKPGYVTVEFQQVVAAGEEYDLNVTMSKPNTDSHSERGTSFVSWHQHEGTPANAFFIPEYNVDVWWGIGRVKMGLDYSKTDGVNKLTKLVVQMKGDKWDCHRVQGDAEVETSAIDIPITLSAGGCSNELTQIDVRKIAIYSDDVEVWSDEGNWTTASDPMNVTIKTFDLPSIPVSWNSDFKIKVWARVQKRSVVGTDGDGSGALYGYHLDKKLITWYPQKPPTSRVSTSWGQVGGYLLGILDNPVNAVANFTDLYTVEQFNQFEMQEVTPADFPD